MNSDNAPHALYFPSFPKKEKGNVPSFIPCLFCEVTFQLESKEEFLRHLLTDHKFVIADVKLVVDLPRYINYWKERFKGRDLKEFCSVIKTNSSQNDQAASEYYHLLCDILPEDKELREKLQKERLETVLEQHRLEREDQNFSRLCLFCRKHFTGNRETLFTHMAEDHSFSVGQPNNIVYGSQFLDMLEEKLKCLQCLYCEKTFKTWDVLKEHMRKKQHKKINPKNSAYDKFYTINYLELGKTWETLENEDDRCLPEVEDTEEWNDWQEEEGLGAVCLFCDMTSTDFDTLNIHMQDAHSFNLQAVRSKLNLNFYQQVKLINFIRREVLQSRCYKCHQKFVNADALSYHLKESGHVTQLPETSDWDQPQFYFSTYENDNLLCIIEDESEDFASGISVVPEDVIVSNENSVLCDELTRLSLVSDNKL